MIKMNGIVGRNYNRIDHRTSSNLPWKKVRLKDITFLNPKLPNIEEIKIDLEVQFLPMKLVEEVSGKIHLTEARKYSDVQKGYTSFVNGDVLFAKVTPCMENGKIAIANSLLNGIGFGSTEFHILRPGPDVLNKYLFYLLVQRRFRHEAASAMTGAVGLRRVPKQFIEEYEISLPPIEEQHLIVSRIEELFSELDKGIEQLKTAKQQLKVYRQAVLKYAFEGRLTNQNIKNGDLPVGWTLSTIGNLFEVFVGSTPSRKEMSYWNGKINWVSSGEVSFCFINQTRERITQQGLANSSCKVHPEGTIILAMIGEGKTRGQAAILRVEASHNQNTAAIRVPPDQIPELLYYYLQLKYEENRKIGSGNNQKALNKERVRGISFPKIPLSEQQIIIHEIEFRLSNCDKIEETINNSLLQAESLHQSILKKAFEGKLFAAAELENIKSLSKSIPEATTISVAAEPVSRYKITARQSPFPKVIEGIKDTDLHAGILAMVIDAHEKTPEHHAKLSHVKGEKIAHLVEAYIGIDLGRTPRKDAAGPDDYPHLKKVESRAAKAGWFGVKKLRVGQTYVSKSGMPKIVNRVKGTLPSEYIVKIEKLIQTFLPFELEHAEVIATLYAAWDNLLLDGKNPTDEEIVFESRENWSKRKLAIEREAFFKALKWMKEHGFVAEGRSKKVK